jgi:methionyl-tRNA formyltransferase
MQIQCLISKKSWVTDKHKLIIQEKLRKFCKKIYFVSNHKKLKKKYDVNFILTYKEKIPNKSLLKSKYNIIVHGSSLPKGRGMSPISWQLLKDVNEIVFTLFNASENYDEGYYFIKKKIKFRGSELFNEIKDIQFNETIKLYSSFLKKIDNLKEKKQIGKPSYFKMRTSKDSKLNMNKTIKNQFNLLRIVDNERYPAYFIYNNKKYILKIYEDKNDKN